MIHWKLCNADKRYTYKPESVLKDEIHKIHCDKRISTRRPDVELINTKKRPCHLVDFAVQANRRVNIKENEKILGF